MGAALKSKDTITQLNSLKKMSFFNNKKKQNIFISTKYVNNRVNDVEINM